MRHCAGGFLPVVLLCASSAEGLLATFQQTLQDQAGCICIAVAGAGHPVRV